MGALSDACTHILNAVDDAYLAANITDPPDRRYVSPGAPPADCELVAVHGVPQVKERGANTNPSVQNCSIIPRAAIQITSWLCVPTGTPPTSAALAEAGARIHDHCWAIWSHLAHLISTKTLHEALDCASAELLNATQLLDEEGAFAGFTIPLVLDLDPFRTDPTS